jgi:hypothetical protein
MFWFGLGTLPLMMAAMVSTGFAGPLFRRRINKTIPFFMLGLGVWFMLRGFNLDIPYLSPPKMDAGVEVCYVEYQVRNVAGFFLLMNEPVPLCRTGSSEFPAS